MKHDITYDDNVARLAAAHPALFSRIIPPFSDLADGWYTVVDRLCTDIERELGPEMAKRFVIEQIKEKFGTLRLYWRLGNESDLHVDLLAPGDTETSWIVEAKPSQLAYAAAIHKARDRLRELVDEACEATAHVCQRCGAAGSLRRLGWMQTLCDQHLAAVMERMERVGDDD